MAKPKSKIVRELLEQGKSIDEIVTETGIAAGYVKAVIRKAGKTTESSE